MRLRDKRIRPNSVPVTALVGFDQAVQQVADAAIAANQAGHPAPTVTSARIVLYDQALVAAPNGIVVSHNHNGALLGATAILANNNVDPLVDAEAYLLPSGQEDLNRIVLRVPNQETFTGTLRLRLLINQTVPA